MDRASTMSRPSHQRLAEIRNRADHFHRHQRSHHPRQSAEHTGLGAGGHAARGRRVREQAAIGRIRAAVRSGLMGADRRQCTVELPESGRDERTLGVETGIGDGIAGREIVRPIGDDIVSANQRDGIVRVDPHEMRFDPHMRVETRHGIGGAVDLRTTDIGRAVNDLPLQIGERDRVVVATMPIAPMPAAARYWISGAPSPPAPMTSTRAACKRACPGPPTSRRTRWRA